MRCRCTSIVGESRAGKTFLAIDLARALSKGGLFVGKRARAGGTLYLAAEAPGTIPGRLQAARLGPLEPFLDSAGRDKGTGQEPSLLSVATGSKLLNLLTDKGRDQLVATALEVSEEMKAKFGLPLRLIVIDTMLATFDIQDWNNPAETRRVMNTLARISEETGTATLGVHHHGKDVSRGAAGSYALTAAADFVLSVFADTNPDGMVSNRRLSVTKLRDAPTGWSCEFDLKPYKIGTDDEGEDMMSAFVDPKTITACFGKSVGSKTKKTPTQSLSAFIKALQESLENFGFDRPNPATGTTVRAVRVSDVRASFARHYQPEVSVGKLADARRQAFVRAKKAAVSEGIAKPGSWDGEECLWQEDK
jgi:AAA domain